MEEKIIIQSEHYNSKKVRNTFLIIGLLLFFVLAIALSVGTMKQYINYYNEATDPNGFYRTHFSSAFEAGIQGVLWYPDGIISAAGISGCICFLGIILFLWMNCELTVTNKRVYGKAALGKSVDLPLDSISAVGSSWLKGITVATSAGRIRFLLIKNRDEIHKRIGYLLIERQNTQSSSTIIQQKLPQSNADELRKYKELLDDDIITQEEFDAKKKQLLGL